MGRKRYNRLDEQRQMAVSMCLKSVAAKTGKPHIRFLNGRPHLFKSYWKSCWPGQASSVTAADVRGLAALIVSHRADATP